VADLILRFDLRPFSSNISFSIPEEVVVFLIQSHHAPRTGGKGQVLAKASAFLSIFNVRQRTMVHNERIVTHPMMNVIPRMRQFGAGELFDVA
jgi:hypothetical protein